MLRLKLPQKVREPREANLASYNDGEVTSYSDVSSLDDDFIEEALFLSPEDRDARDVETGSFEDWAQEEAEEDGEIVEVARAERDGLGGHHGAHHRAGHDMPEQRQVVRRRGSRRQQKDSGDQERRQRPREDRQTGDTGPAFGVLSSPPNQVVVVVAVVVVVVAEQPSQPGGRLQLQLCQRRWQLSAGGVWPCWRSRQLQLRHTGGRGGEILFSIDWDCHLNGAFKLA